MSSKLLLWFIVLLVVSATNVFAQALALQPSERHVLGEYVAGPDSRGDWFEFDGNHAFAVHILQMIPVNKTAGPAVDSDPREKELVRTGEYRLVGSQIQLMFWDGTDASMEVRAWGKGGVVKSIRFGKYSFTQDWVPATAENVSVPPESGPESGYEFAEVEPIEVIPLPDPNESKHNTAAVLDALGAVFRVFTFFVSATAPAPQASQQTPRTEPAHAATENSQPAKKDAPRNFGSTRGEKRKP